MPGTQSKSGRSENDQLEIPLHLLVVDDEEQSRELCVAMASARGFRVSTASDGNGALQILESDSVDIVLADVTMPGMNGLELLQRIKDLSPTTEVIIMTAFGTVATAVQAMRLGAYDYLTKPFNKEEFSLILERLVGKLDLENENLVLREQIRKGGFARLLGNSPPMLKLFKLISKVSQNTYPVLIQGESGTGKELVARSIHESGPLVNKPFLPIDCGSLVPTLIESELFGYVRGAFTGAVRTKEGLLEAAGGGTVFLDEIGEMPVDLQSKFLRALQEKEVRPVGGSRRVKIEARIIAATNRDLEVAVQQGHFRKDLYFRLNVVSLKLPPLRDRKGDIPLLVNHLIEKYKAANKPRLAVSEEAMNRLLAYDWPGNVRELENCIERAVALGSGPVLQSSDLTTNLQYGRSATGAMASGMAASAGGGSRSVAAPSSSAAERVGTRLPMRPIPGSGESGGGLRLDGAGDAFVPTLPKAGPGSMDSFPRSGRTSAPISPPIPWLPPSRRTFPGEQAGSSPNSHPPATNSAADAGSEGGVADRIVPLAELERRAIVSAVREADGDKLLAARLLGIGKTTLYRKLKEYGVS
jgi:DNA-binding NtrC family response regulator